MAAHAGGAGTAPDGEVSNGSLPTNDHFRVGDRHPPHLTSKGVEGEAENIIRTQGGLGRGEGGGICEGSRDGGWIQLLRHNVGGRTRPVRRGAVEDKNVHRTRGTLPTQLELIDLEHRTLSRRDGDNGPEVIRSRERLVKRARIPGHFKTSFR